ncbi:MAG: SusC/RagA family TonB-linked outer membrane protein, partial [Muribaculaceae bacterium]|nr:SusC/RagA family TonB-linked outer membrane protein [Muribaculaceae bacterium]
YQKELLKGVNARVTADFKNVSLNELLNTVVTDQLGLIWKQVKNTIVLSKRVTKSSTAVKLSGVVVDWDGEPVPGASVRVSGENTGVSTNVDGEFTILAPLGSTLLFTYIGMQPEEVTVDSNKKIRVEMNQMSTMLSDVVVTGYQEIKKEKMTGAVTTISADKLDERYTTNLLDNLEGRVAGLSTYGGQMVIRGLGSLHASTTPLLVVDGLPIEGSIDDLNPGDIESVNVLKDASASAIYGARAANGIIVVTTKNAKRQGKLDIDFSANVTMYENKNMDYHDNFYLSPEEHIAAECELYEWKFFQKDDRNNPASKLQEESMYIQSGYLSPTPIEYAYYQLATGEIDRNQLNKTIESLKGNNYAKDYADAVYRRQVVQQYNLAMRSSSDKSRNNVVVNYKYDNSGVKSHKNDWLNVSYKGSFDVAKWLTATVSINSVISNTRTYGQDFNGQMGPWGQAPYVPFYNTDGSVKRQYAATQGGNQFMSFGEAFHDLSTSPLDEIYNSFTTEQRNSTRYHGDLLFKIIPGLTANTQFIYETENTNTEWQANEQSYTSRMIRNAYTFSDGRGGYEYLTPENGGLLRTTNTRSNAWTARGQLNYSGTFGKHDVAAIAGMEFRETLYKGTRSVLFGYDDQLQSSNTTSIDFQSLSMINRNPAYFSMLGGFPLSSVLYNYILPGFGLVPEQHHRYASGYFNLTYTFDEKYNVFGSFRKDYADVFGLNSKFRGKPLWSAGIGWNIHNEAFARDITWINFLKLRASYGVTGNIYQGATSVMTASTDGTNRYNNYPVATVSSPANPDLRWEQNRTTNVGLDFSLFNYRLRGNVDYYIKKGVDIFNGLNLDPTYGFTSMVANVASIENRGIEATVAYDWFRPRRRRDFSWTTSVTFTYNKNEVTKVENDAQQASTMFSNPYKVGYPVSALWSYKFVKIQDTGNRIGMPLYDKGSVGTSYTREILRKDSR